MHWLHIIQYPQTPTWKLKMTRHTYTCMVLASCEGTKPFNEVTSGAVLGMVHLASFVCHYQQHPWYMKHLRVNALCFAHSSEYLNMVHAIFIPNMSLTSREGSHQRSNWVKTSVLSCQLHISSLRLPQSKASCSTIHLGLPSSQMNFKTFQSAVRPIL
jgi:hypothetical protein